MIFTYKLADAIIEGRKTVTRRPIVRLKRMARGDIMSIQRGYNIPCAHVRILRCDPETTKGVVSDDEARKEGCADAADFLRTWRGIYGSLPIEVWRIEFELISDSGAIVGGVPETPEHARA